MTRYWQHKGGEVYPDARSPIPVDDWTEVRVVSLDAIVIERSELPAVDPEVEGMGVLAGDNYYEETPEDLRGLALELLAAAEYLTAHPPVDEVQVSALEAVMCAVNQPHGYRSFRELAELLIATGKVTVTTDGGAS